MPNRIIRDGILTSESVDKLGVDAELFYRRLMSVVDDFGRYTAHPSLLRAACYPLRVDSIREGDITRFLEEVQNAGLIVLYEVDGKRYLQMHKVDEPRAKKSKFPGMPASANICAQTQTNVPYSYSYSYSSSNLKTQESGEALTGMYARSPLFEQFIKIYPRASAPEAAWVEWQAKVYTEAMRHGKPDAEIEEMIVRAAQEFRDSPAGKPPDGSQDYRPAAAKWLQGNCWEEPRELWQQPNGKVATKSRQPAKPKIRPLEVDQKIGQQLQDLMK